MAIPDTPLKLSIGTEQLTLGEIALFQGDFSAVRLIKFLVSHGNWTREQVEDITLAEMRQVAEQIGDALKGAAVPKAN